MTAPALSVIICTYNPRPDYLARTLDGLQAQSLAVGSWELLIIDNASRTPVTGTIDLAWHPQARVIREDEVGLTAARLCAIDAARAPLLLFVDDDNILAPDYLAAALQLEVGWPMLGVWGCGRYTPEWETPPHADFGPYLAYLAVHEAPRDRWSNQAFDYGATPAGAGLCVRATVARRYAASVRNDPRRKLLGRTGAVLSGCEDFDLALTAVDEGLGVGLFRSLALVHLMPSVRVTEAYLLRLIEGHAHSTVLLHAMRDPNFTAPRKSLLASLREFRLRRSLGPIPLKIHEARRRGETSAWNRLAALAG
jgi:GT2 family glycosyltransferase